MQIRFLSVALALMTALGSLVPLAAESAPPPVAPPTALEYNPTDQTDQHALRVDIAEVLLSNADTGMKGCATGQVELTTQSAVGDGAGVTLRVALTKLHQQMCGHLFKSALPPPVLLRLDRYARLTDAPCQQVQAAGEILSQGGLPLQALAVICAVPQLPDHPVSPGDTWHRQATYNFPGLGRATLDFTTTLVSLQDGVATLNSHLIMHAPDFDADNPVLPGQKVKVHNLVVEVTDLRQQYDSATSMVLQSSGKLQASLEATAPDITLPLKLTATVAYCPVAP